MDLDLRGCVMCGVWALHSTRMHVNTLLKPFDNHFYHGHSTLLTLFGERSNSGTKIFFGFFPKPSNHLVMS